MIKVLFIDLDNTLIETQALYRAAEESLVGLIAGGCSASEEEILARLYHHQVEISNEVGYAAELLPRAYEQTLLDFIPDAAEEERAEACRIANNVYDSVAGIKAGVAESLAALSKHYTLYIVTAGDEEVQQKRVAALPFKDLFENIFIVNGKDAALFEELLKKTGFTPDEAAMIGDSLRSDIIPAVEAGMHALYISSDNWTQREMDGHELPKGSKVESHESFFKAATALISRKTGMPPRPQNQPPAPGQ